MRLFIVFILVVFSHFALEAQTNRWQQRAVYNMDIDFDVEKHRFSGKQNLIYINNSPDTLYKVFYHLYFNAFQPGSMMDERSRSIPDPDPRVVDRISKLKANEMGFQKIKELKHNGEPVKFKTEGTILEVSLKSPIMPHSTAVFDMNFDAQVPIQIRRSGRNNKEGIDYSMSQWYPKMCEYDYQGWHANSYVSREFYGIWGDFDVKITIDKKYILGGTGYLQNSQEIGYGYETPGTKVKRTKGKKLTWHFIAPNVHDFVWAADPDYTHTTHTTDEGIKMHFLFQKNENTEEGWAALPKIMASVFKFASKNYGQYPYKQYSFIQGGDGGMEYPMATLITGERNLGSLVGVSVHELMHSWYQMILGTNESLYAWMDEGFTSYTSAEVMNHLKDVKIMKGEVAENPHSGSYIGYRNFSASGIEEPLSTHADHFVTNSAYSIAAYVKGAVFLHQLQYIIGKKAFNTGMIRYFNNWKFKHPNLNDFIRIMEKQSGLELDWYKEYWVNTTHTIDYGIKAVEEAGRGTSVTLQKNGVIPMPLDVTVTYQDGSETIFHIPLRVMRGEKKAETANKREVLQDWPWTHESYTFSLVSPRENIKKIEIDASGRLADVNENNNIFENKETGNR